MYQQKIKKDTLASSKKAGVNFEIGIKTRLNNFKVIALKEKKSGDDLETDKAKSADKLKTSFFISGNTVAKTGKRVFYVQVLDQKNNVLGEDKLIHLVIIKHWCTALLLQLIFREKA